MTTPDPTTSAVSGYMTRLDPNRRVSLSYRSDGRYLITGQTGAETRRMGLTEEAMNAAVQMYAALKAARRFIENGIETGAIRMPDAPDPALDTLPTIIAALAKAAP